jgi:hypothetical protein
MSIGRNRVRQQVQEIVTLQWANGKNEARTTPGHGRFVSHVGFYVEAGKDAAFDAAMEAAGITQMEIRHPRQGAPAQIVRHWNLGEQITLYPITSGPVTTTVATSLSPRNINATVEAGIGMRWGRGEGERSRMSIRGFLAIGKDVYPGLVQFSVRSRMTDELLVALIDHVRVCEIADSLVDRSKHPEIVQCHELGMPLGSGKEEQWGKGETTTVTPCMSLHPATVDLPYLRSIWRPDVVAEQAPLHWADIQAWAQEFSFAAPTQTNEEQQPSEEMAYANGHVTHANDVL